MKKSLSRVYKIEQIESGAGHDVRPLELNRISDANKIDSEVRLLQTEREAYQKGFEAGEKAGFEFGTQKAEVIVKRLSNILSELSTIKADTYKEMEQEIAKLALAIAKQIIHYEVGLNNEVVMHVTKAAIKAAHDGNDVMTIKVNPSDFEYMVKAKPEVLSHIDGVKNINIEEDETVSKGGCVLETLYDEVDARLEQGFKEIEKAVNGMLKKEE
ncbi:MAG: hypothetical protein HZB79_11935 [Deltaproteobacteria bacterium]|nr:hypothetical protein [Deltaproteobacteria bacterium]